MQSDTFGELTQYRIPPQSTGGRVSHRRFIAAEVEGVSNTDIPLGSQYTLSNGLTGFVTQAFFLSATKTRVTLTYDRMPVAEFETGPITFNNTSSGTVTDFIQILIPAAVITDPNNPNEALSINDKGAASVTFSEGEPQLDAFGVLKTASYSTIFSYKFTDNFSINNFLVENNGTGTANRNTTTSCYDLDVGAANGDSVKATTNIYHKYYTGFATQALISSFCGDSGKNGNTRRWGLYDAEDGVFFELEGSELFLVKRSSASGSMIEIRIPQSDFNVDVVDGSESRRNKSGFSVNVQNNNLFFFEFAWLGSGSLRVGMYDERGRRITCHNFEDSSNVDPYAFWRNPNLPLTFECFNTQATASPTRFSLICSSVSTHASDTRDSTNSDSSIQNFIMDETKPVTSLEPSPVLALKMSGLLHGERNRKKAAPTRITAHVKNSPIILKVFYGVILSDENWQDVNPLTSSVQYDIDATGFTAVPQTAMVSHYVLDPGSHSLSVSEFFNTRSNFFSPNVDGTDSPVLLMTAKGIDGAAEVLFGAQWVEL